jgi:GAF domain-containing protein
MAADDATEAVLERWRVRLGAAACSLALLDDAGQHLTFTAAVGQGQGIVGTQIAVGSGMAGYAVVSGEVMVVDDLADDARFLHQLAADAGYVPRAMIVAPVEVGDEIHGVVEVLDPDPSGTYQSRMQLVNALADELAGAVGGAGRTTHPWADLVRRASELPPQDEAIAAAVLTATIDALRRSGGPR